MKERVINLISGTLLREQLRRFWPLMLLCMLGYLLFVIFPLYLHPGGRDVHRSAQVMIDLLSMRHPFLLLAIALIPFGTVILLFSPLLNARTTVGFYQLSDSKNQLFWTNALSGLILMVVPLLLLCAAMLIRVHLPSFFDGQDRIATPFDLFSRMLLEDALINTFPVVLEFFLRVALSMLFYFSLFLLAVTLSGSAIAAGFLCLVLPFVPALLHRFGTLVTSVYVFGYDAPDLPPMEQILAYANPLTWFWQTLVNAIVYVFGFADIPPPAPERISRFTNPLTWGWTWGHERQRLYVLAYIAGTVLLLGAARACFVARRIEHAGELIVFRPFKNVLIFLLSVTGMMAMGRFFLLFVSGRWFLYYGFVLGFALTFCVAQMVFEKSCDIRHKLKWLPPSAGIVAALYGLMLLTTLFGARFYTHYVPEPGQVIGVYLSHEARWTESERFRTDSTSIEEAIQLHQQILGIQSDLTRTEQSDHRSDMRDAFWQSISGSGRRFSDNGGLYLYISYQLDNGDVLFRRYALPGTFLAFLAEQNDAALRLIRQ